MADTFSLWDVVLGNRQRHARDPHNAFVGRAFGANPEQVVDLVCDVDADHGEGAIIELKDIRRAADAGGGVEFNGVLPRRRTALICPTPRQWIHYVYAG